MYVPTEDELKSGSLPVNPAPERIYKMVSCTGNRSFFIPFSVSKIILDKEEFLSLNKIEKALSGEMIKEICIPLRVNRLGKIMYNL